MDRRTFIASLAAALGFKTLPAGCASLRSAGSVELNGRSWGPDPLTIPIVYGEISDELMPKPPYWRAHEMGAVYKSFDGNWTRLELVRG